MDSSLRVRLYPILSDSLLVQTSKTQGLSSLQGKYKSLDPSSIFAATRIFLKKLELLSDKALDWDSELFQCWLVQFTNAHLIRHDNGDYSFILHLSKDFVLPETQKVQLLTLSDLKFGYSTLYEEFELANKEVQEALRYYENTERSKNTFAVFDCEPDPRWNNYYNALYMGYVKNKGEVWRSYKIPDLQFPTEEELGKIKGIVISGSSWSAYNTSVEAIPIFLERLRNLVRDHPEIKIVGVCFGCQALAQALGGKVEKMKLENTPMLMNREKINFLNGFRDKYLAGKFSQYNVEDLDSLFIVECHGDHVVNLPENAVLYGNSSKTNVEIFGIKDNVIAFQGHPEFNAEFMVKKIFPEVKQELENVKEALENSKESLYSGEADQRLIGMMMERFLKQ